MLCDWHIKIHCSLQERRQAWKPRHREAVTSLKRGGARSVESPPFCSSRALLPRSGSTIPGIPSCWSPSGGILAVSRPSQPLPVSPHNVLSTQQLGDLRPRGAQNPRKISLGLTKVASHTGDRQLTKQTTSPSRDRSEWEKAYTISLPKNSNLNLLTLTNPPTKSEDKGQRSV